MGRLMLQDVAACVMELPVTKLLGDTLGPLQRARLCGILRNVALPLLADDNDNDNDNDDNDCNDHARRR